jgi:hypothetical protein
VVVPLSLPLNPMLLRRPLAMLLRLARRAWSKPCLTNRKHRKKMFTAWAGLPRK